MSAHVNRWGVRLTPGTHVTDHNGVAFTYVRLDTPSDYSRAYGPQAIVVAGYVPLTEARRDVEEGAYSLRGTADLRRA